MKMISRYMSQFVHKSMIKKLVMLSIFFIIDDQYQQYLYTQTYGRSSCARYVKIETDHNIGSLFEKTVYNYTGILTDQ